MSNPDDDRSRGETRSDTDAASAAGASAKRDAERLSERARRERDRLHQRAEEAAESHRRDAGERVETVSGALFGAAEDIDPNSLAGHLLSTASRGLDDVAEHLKHNDLNDLVSQVERFGRRNPVAFLGAAALTGFALSRFATAQAPEASRENDPLGANVQAQLSDKIGGARLWMEVRPTTGRRPPAIYCSGLSAASPR